MKKQIISCKPTKHSFVSVDMTTRQKADPPTYKLFCQWCGLVKPL